MMRTCFLKKGISFGLWGVFLFLLSGCDPSLFVTLELVQEKVFFLYQKKIISSQSMHASVLGVCYQKQKVFRDWKMQVQGTGYFRTYRRVFKWKERTVWKPGPEKASFLCLGKRKSPQAALLIRKEKYRDALTIPVFFQERYPFLFKKGNWNRYLAGNRVELSYGFIPDLYRKQMVKRLKTNLNKLTPFFEKGFLPVEWKVEAIVLEGVELGKAHTFQLKGNVKKVVFSTPSRKLFLRVEISER